MKLTGARAVCWRKPTPGLSRRESIRRRVAGDANRPRLNVVIFLEESLGSEFWGCLGRKDTLTPDMDKLAAQEGMLFTNLLPPATGPCGGSRACCPPSRRCRASPS